MQYIKIRHLTVSRFTIGGNFSGFSHQGVDRDKEMRDYIQMSVLFKN